MSSLFAIGCMSPIHLPYISIGIGNIIAAILSWKRNQDILWAVIAFIFSWLYIVYWLFTNKQGS